MFASAFASGEGPGYARQSNPTWEAFEAALGALEGGAAVTFASGMAAADAVLDALPADSRVIVARSAYLEVRRLLARGPLEVSEVDPLDTKATLAALEHADVLWLDAITNPNLEVPELDLLLAAARRAGVLSVVDSTLATPVLLRPLELGADLVLHSATKYIGGHSDLMLGAAVARDPRLAARLRETRTATGAVPGTMEAWLGLRGMRTLPLRVERGVETAALLAGRLAGASERRIGSLPGARRRPGPQHGGAAAGRIRSPGLVRGRPRRARRRDLPRGRGDRPRQQPRRGRDADRAPGRLARRPERARRAVATQRRLRGPGGSVARPRARPRRLTA